MARRDPDTALRVPDVPSIVAFRNVLAHGYDGIDDELVWAILEGQLTSLLTTLQRLLGEA
ncbi:MAG: DUF86 domain-containing protein [Dehalococcoidia bacterium]|nr:DUF86 domain-containing protein [Dehalococcoidia bacterium]